MEKTKLHLGCGGVYLKDYINIDAVGQLAKNNPILVEENLTTVKHYFKRPYNLRKFGHNKRRVTVVDLRQDIKTLSTFEDNSVSEILSVNLINHLRYQDFLKAIKEWHRVLKKRGLLIIDVDDVIDNCKNVIEAKNKDEIEIALRYLYCHSRDKYDSHHWGYTEWYLKDILKEHRFKFEWRNDNFIYHDANYPRFITAFSKE